MGATDETPFPLAIDGLTPEFLSDALGRRYPGTRVESFEIVSSAVHGSGSTSTADRLVLDLDYATVPEGASLPSRMLLKTMLAEPHVPITMYENEVLFYRNIRPELDVEAPEVFVASFDAASGRFGILMEDLTRRGARFLQATDTLTVDQMSAALDALADLHATHWESPRLTAEWSWLPTASRGGMADVFRTAEWFQHVEACVAATETKQTCLDDIGRTVEQVWADVWKVIEGPLSKGPQTFLHGDCHMANTYLLPEDRIGLLDWQLASRGIWAQDLCYLMATALDIEIRRENERSLLDHYFDRLRGRGVGTVPGRDDAWNTYRQGVMWGFAIGWLGCPAENYPAEVMDANLIRLSTAVRDLQTVQVIDS